MPNLRIVTTSWDDGDENDIKLAELLHSRGLLGTFYVPAIPYRNGTTLAAADLRTFASEGFEIGAHCNRRQYRSDRSDCQVQGRYLLEVATPLRDLFEPRWGRRMADGDSVTIGG